MNKMWWVEELPTHLVPEVSRSPQVVTPAPRGQQQGGRCEPGGLCAAFHFQPPGSSFQKWRSSWPLIGNHWLAARAEQKCCVPATCWVLQRGETLRPWRNDGTLILLQTFLSWRGVVTFSSQGKRSLLGEAEMSTNAYLVRNRRHWW